MEYKYQCIACDYFTLTSSNLIKHQRTTKHINNINNIETRKYKCNCGKYYSTRQTLQQHKNNKICLLPPQKMIEPSQDVIKLKENINPISLPLFFDTIKFTEINSPIDKLLKELFLEYSLSMLSTAYLLLDLDKKPFYVIDRGNNNNVFIFKIDEEWIEQTELEIVYDIIKLGKNIKDKNCFIYYFSIFYDHMYTYFYNKYGTSRYKFMIRVIQNSGTESINLMHIIKFMIDLGKITQEEFQKAIPLLKSKKSI